MTSLILAAALLAARPSPAASTAAPALQPILALPVNPDSYDDNDAFRKHLLDGSVSDWYSLSGGAGMIVVVQKGYLSQDQLARLGRDLDEARTRIPALLGRPAAYAGRLTIYVYDDGPMSEADVPGAFAGEKGLMLRFVREDTAPLFHEMTHIYAGDTKSQSLCEGIAQWVQGVIRPGKANGFQPANADPDALAKAGIAQYPRPFYDAIGAPEWNSWSGQEVRMAFYYASWSFTGYLIRRGGMPAFLSVMDGNAEPQAYLRAYGETLETLRQQWADGLRR